jgi:hypothetical protein
MFDASYGVLEGNVPRLISNQDVQKEDPQPDSEPGPPRHLDRKIRPRKRKKAERTLRLRCSRDYVTKP